MGTSALLLFFTAHISLTRSYQPKCVSFHAHFFSPMKNMELKELEQIARHHLSSVNTCAFKPKARFLFY